ATAAMSTLSLHDALPISRTVATISVLAGIVILLAGIAEVFNAVTASSWRWLHGILGVVFIATGIVAFFRPGGTFAMLAAFIGWRSEEHTSELQSRENLVC